MKYSEEENIDLCIRKLFILIHLVQFICSICTYVRLQHCNLARGGREEETEPHKVFKCGWKKVSLCTASIEAFCSFVCHVTTFDALEYIISSTEVCVYLGAIHVHFFSSLTLCISNLCDIHNVNERVFCDVVGNNFCEMAFQNEKQFKTHFVSLRINFVHYILSSVCTFLFTFINKFDVLYSVHSTHLNLYFSCCIFLISTPELCCLNAKTLFFNKKTTLK